LGFITTRGSLSTFSSERIAKVNLKLFIVKSLIFVSIFWVASYVLAKTLDAAFRQDRSDKQSWVFSQHNLSVDYAVAGSSRAFNNVDATTLLKRTGRPAINIGNAGQSIMDMYLTLHLFLAHENRIENLLLQIDGADLDYSHKFLPHTYLPYMSYPEVAATVREVGGLKRYVAMKAFPLGEYWEYNDFYNLEHLQRARSGVSTYDKNAGSDLLYDDTYHALPSIPDEPAFVVDLRSRRYLDRIVQLVENHGIKLTIFSAPMYHHDQLFKKYDEAARAYIVRYCQERGIPYLDFTDAKFDRTEFRDHGHLNSVGALRFTAMLADSLMDGSQNRSLPAGD
jgi:hypothetical protein